MSFIAMAEQMLRCEQGLIPCIREENTAFCLKDRVLYILGTNDGRDVLDDLSFLPVSCCGGKAHAGFVRHAQCVAEVMRERMEEVDCIVGHSLGGAAAQIIGLSHRKNTVTFGSPRVWFDTPKAIKAGNAIGYWHTRIYNTADPVVSLPPGWLGWDHQAHASVKFGPAWWRSLFTIFVSRKHRVLHYHLMPAYIAGLKASPTIKTHV